jgi:hypothetical protein
MLSNTDLTPTRNLNTICSKAIMQVQTAVKLGRLPSITSILLSVMSSELELFNECNRDVAIDDITTLKVLKPYVKELQRSSAPPTLVRFILAADNRKDLLHSYYPIPRLAQLLLERGKDLDASTMNSINCYFKNTLNGFNAVTPAAKSLYHQIDIDFGPYQVL